MKVKHDGSYWFVKFGNYQNGRTAIRLSAGFENLLVASVNLPEVELQDDEILIKDYSENVGVLKSLQEAGIVGEVLGYYPSGYVQIPKVKLLRKAGE